MLRLASWNLRYDSQPDRISVDESLRSLPDPSQSPEDTSYRQWTPRRIEVARTLLREDVQIIGFQEALVRQVDDLLKLLGEDTWQYVGVGREDGENGGEFSPIFYKRSEFNLLSTDTFWLSHTPFKPSKFPGAGSTRICTVARFSKASEGGDPITIMNTHLDDSSDAQRKLGSSLILARAKYEAASSDGLVFLSGDFNSSSSGKDDSAYKIMTGDLAPVSISEEFLERFKVPLDTLPDFRMIDARTKTSPLNISGNFATYTGFKSPENSSWNTARIDFIFGGNNVGWLPTSYSVPSALIDDGTLASDHRPIFVRVSQEST
ncbi:DNase I-like protein [Schizopora paradoxa]|uniref:DNase I-like protein n=1 Tax=Schizopora paradoxa TaxID=27342 RepID=A0A0H2S2I0_9AGAM|nr:DNase I-like protein [Schizopora paradoxa]